MAGIKLSKRVVDALQPRERSYIVYDAATTGFGCRVSPSGKKSWIVEYRPGVGGRGIAKRRMTPRGQFTDYTPDQARVWAQDILADVRKGRDPARERSRLRELPTLAEVIKRFLAEEAELLRKPRTAALYRDYLTRLVVPALGNCRITDVTRSQVTKLHSQIGTRTPTTANRVVAVLSTVFSFAARVDLLPDGFDNPARKIAKFREQARQRFLSVAELERLGAAIREAETTGIAWTVDETTPRAKHAPKPDNRRTIIGPHAAAALRLLIFTGARLREILHLRWQEVDLQRGLLLLTDSKTGAKPIVLGAPALRILIDLPRVGDVFIAGDSPNKPRADLNRPWSLVSRRAGLEGVRLHDLRHTYASYGAGAGLGLPIIGKLLGHKQASTTARYSHLDADPLRRAADAIGAAVASAMNGPDGCRQSAEILPLRRSLPAT